MHILYIHQYFATPKGRTGTRSYEFARRWVEAGHRVTMLTSVSQLTPEELGDMSGRLVKRIDIDGIELMVLNVAYRQAMGPIRRMCSFFLFMVLTCWFALRIPRVDVVYATSTPLTVGIPALLAWWLRRRRYVFEVRDVWPAVPVAMGIIRNRLAILLFSRLERMIYRGARAIVALSPGMEKMVREAGPGHKPIVTVTNCSDVELFRPDLDGAAVRRERRWDGRFICIHTGGVGTVNGLDWIIGAADHLRDDPDFLFVLVGKGNKKELVLAELKRRGLTNLIIVDAMSKNELPRVVAAADVCLVTFMSIPIMEDNSANKFFDSLSAGKPVLLNYSGWQREIIEQAGAGFGCDLGNEQQFFQRLSELKNDPELRCKMGANARHLALTRFNRDLLSQRALEVAEGVAAHRSQ